MDESDSHLNRATSILVQDLKQEVFDEATIQATINTYLTFLQKEPIVFSRIDKQQLLQDALQQVCDDILANTPY